MSLLPYYTVATLVGAAVGVVEIFQRYRAEPLPAVANKWGVGYLLFNAGVATAAFYVVVLVEGLGPESGPLGLLKWSATAGFGAAALLRAKLMDIQLADGKEVALGPEIVVQTFLAVIDRELDRLRAKDRFDAVRRLMTGVDFERSKTRLTMQVFQAMQGVREEETETLMARVREVEQLKSVSDQDRAYMLGFYLLDLVGEPFLADILAKYRDDFKAEPAPGAASAAP